MRRVGVPIVVQPIVRNPSLFGDGLPELLDVLQRPTRSIAGQKICLGGVCFLPHFSEQAECWSRKRNMLCSLLLCMMRGLCPNAALEIDIGPTPERSISNVRFLNRPFGDPVSMSLTGSCFFSESALSTTITVRRAVARPRPCGFFDRGLGCARFDMRRPFFELIAADVLLQFADCHHRASLEALCDKEPQICRA
jgi:hypothetical protein